MALLISAKVGRSGKMFVLGVTTDAPGTTGYPPLALISAVASSGLTVFDNGTPITLVPAAWADGTNGNALVGAVVGYHITSGPIAPGHTVTFTVPSAFITANSLSSPAVTGGAVTNFSGLAHGTPEGAWGHMPPLPTSSLIPVGWNIGQNAVNLDTTGFIGKDKMLLCTGWGVLSGSGALSLDGNGYPASWTVPATTVLASSVWSPNGLNQLASDKGWGNTVGVWTVYHEDSAFGTSEQKTVALATQSGDVAIGSPTVTMVSGIIRTAWPVAYNTASPANWNLQLKLTVSAPSATGGTSSWTIANPCAPGIPGNPYVVPPDARTGDAAATPDFTKPYAVDDNVLASWVTSGGVGPFLLRVMESFGGAILDNRIYKCDLVKVNRASWQGSSTYTATAGFVRRFSTDGSLTWQTTRAYGPQAKFITPDTTTYTLGVTLTANSEFATVTSGTPQLCGSSVTSVSGTGSIPAGTLLAHFAGSTVQFDDIATVSGAATITLQHPNYLPLAAGDNGAHLNAAFGFGQAPFQLRFTSPHPFTTGQQISVQANHNAISFTNGVGSIDFSDGGAFNVRVWVNDAFTISFVLFVGDDMGSTTFTVIDSTTEYDFTGTGGWTVATQVSSYPNGYPDEFMAAACTELGADYYVNLEDFATDRLHAARAQRIVANGGPSLKVRVEYHNEVWNGGPPFSLSFMSHRALAFFGAYLTTGTNWLHYYTARSGQLVPFFGNYATGPAALCAGYAQLVFTTAWTAAGASGSRIIRLFGSGFSQQPVTAETAGALQLWGMPCDFIVLAPYYSMLQFDSVVALANAAGGNCPVDAYLDFWTAHYTANFYVQNTLAEHRNSITAGWGQPPGPLTPSVGGSGSSLNGGGYSIAYTYVDGLGRQTTIGQSQGSGFSISSGQVISTQMPSVPPWVASINLYLGDSGGSVYFLVNNYPSSTVPGTTLSITSFDPAAPRPPTTNGAAASAGTPPDMGTYEGIPATIAPVNLPGWGAFEHDCRAHPSYRDLMYAYCASLMIGEQSTGGGPRWVNLFEYYFYPNWSSTGPGSAGFTEFEACYGQSQLPGQGLTNTYATAQGWAGTSTPGVTPDGADHNGGAPFVDARFGGVEKTNESPGALGVLDFMSGISPTPTPTSTAARRALPGLRTI